MSCESQQGNGLLPQAVYLSILTILPGDYFRCFERMNIISEPEIKSGYNRAFLPLLNKPLNLLFKGDSLFFIKQLKSSA